MDTFKTVVRNEGKNPLVVYERFGPLLSIWPGNERTIETDDPEGMYAPFDRVTWLESGEVKIERRPGWKEPLKGRWTIKCLNLHGKAVEERGIGGSVVVLPRGIPRTVEVQLLDSMVIFKSLAIKSVAVNEPNPRHPHYLSTRHEVKDVFEDRDKDELDEIQRLVEAEQNKHSAPDDAEFT